MGEFASGDEAMTPLAQRIVKEILLPFNDRTFNDKARLLSRMDDIHCFECSDVLELAKDLGNHALCGSVDERMGFLPAPKTWIEFVEDGDNGNRTGLFLQQVCGPDGNALSACVTGANYELSGDLGLLLLGDPSPIGGCANDPRFDSCLYGLLAIINTPRIIGRRQHMPHRGLERRLLKQRKNIGRFPLNAWTEIRLHVTPPKDSSGEESHEAHLTGQRALHFCRAHLRIRCGRLEVVRAHWRGDASLGIKRSRYQVSP